MFVGGWVIWPNCLWSFFTLNVDWPFGGLYVVVFDFTGGLTICLSCGWFYLRGGLAI